MSSHTPGAFVALSSLHRAWQMRAHAISDHGEMNDDGDESDFSDGSASDCSTEWDSGWDSEDMYSSEEGL